MTVPDLVNLSALIDDAKCFALVRQHRWPEGVHCPACGSNTVVRDGFDESQVHRQRYRCKVSGASAPSRSGLERSGCFGVPGPGQQFAEAAIGPVIDEL